MSAVATKQIVGPDGRPLISEQRLARRQAARRSLRARYDAAQTHAGNEKHWAAADSLSARESNSPGVRKTLRMRSRYEVHGANSFANGIVRTLVNDIFGRGPRLQVTDRRLRKEQKQLVERRWRRWYRAARVNRELRTGVFAYITDGEGFLHESTRNSTRDACKLAIRATEADQIASYTTWLDTPTHVDGINLDSGGDPVSYERLKYHPGDAYSDFGPDAVETIPAASMIHLFRAERPGQKRGIPWMTPALPLFALLRRYTLAVLRCAEVAADIGGVIYSDHPMLDQIEPVEAMDEILLEMGMFLTLPEGYKLGQLKAEQPTTVFDMFRDAILVEIARCTSMPKNKALGNSGGYNYASGMLDFQTYFEMIQVERDGIEIECLDTVLDWWLDEALLIPGYLEGLPPLPDGLEHSWMWDQFTHVDPTKTANSTETLWQIGLCSDEDYLLSKGKDPEEHYAELERQTERRRELGLAQPGGSTPAESMDRRAKQAQIDAAEAAEPAGAAA